MYGRLDDGAGQLDTIVLRHSLSNNEMTMTRIAYFDLDEAARLFNPPPPIISDYERERLAQQANYERLKAARLLREATANRSTL